MLKVIDEKLIGTKKEAIKHFENIINFLDDKEHVQKVNNILEELKKYEKVDVKIYFNPMDEEFHLLD